MRSSTSRVGVALVLALGLFAATNSATVSAPPKTAPLICFVDSRSLAPAFGLSPKPVQFALDKSEAGVYLPAKRRAAHACTPRARARRRGPAANPTAAPSRTADGLFDLAVLRGTLVQRCHGVHCHYQAEEQCEAGSPWRTAAWHLDTFDKFTLTCV